MRLIERTADTILFACPVCDDSYAALRCRATSKTRGGRDGIGSQCNSIALSGSVTCRVHRQDEILGIVAGPTR
jgi:hypothetical protein